MSDIDKTNFRECAQRAIDQHHKNGEIIASLVWSHIISLYESELAVRGIVLPGWTCAHCQGFNSAAKEWLKECRGCGEKGPPQP